MRFQDRVTPDVWITPSRAVTATLCKPSGIAKLVSRCQPTSSLCTMTDSVLKTQFSVLKTRFCVLKTQSVSRKRTLGISSRISRIFYLARPAIVPRTSSSRIPCVRSATIM